MGTGVMTTASKIILKQRQGRFIKVKQDTYELGVRPSDRL